jgi:hypothetical protein
MDRIVNPKSSSRRRPPKAARLTNWDAARTLPHAVRSDVHLLQGLPFTANAERREFPRFARPVAAKPRFMVSVALTSGPAAERRESRVTILPRMMAKSGHKRLSRRNDRGFSWEERIET